MQLRSLLGSLIPFALVVLVQFYRSTMSANSWLAVKAERKPAQAQARAVRSGPAPFNGSLEYPDLALPKQGMASVKLTEPPLSLAAKPAAAAQEPAAAAQEPPAQAVPEQAAAASSEKPVDPSRNWPPPTKSSKRLIDGSPNYLPVPNAEGPSPDDLAWRKQVTPTGPCPVGRKPYHTILTAQASLYQQWQTKIFYYHFRRVQREGGRCTEMTGFTRLLAGKSDDLMDAIPTVAVPEVGHDKTRGFPVINRPWSILKWLEREDEWNARVTEDYVYIAETDHLLRHDLPNRATPSLAVAFFFPYMSPKDPKCGAVAQKWLPGLDKDDMPPVGPSPAIMHVDHLRKLAPSWYQISVDLKADHEADRAFGWMLEMWGYAIAACRLGIKHFVWQKIQIEPSAAWHQDLSAQDPYIYHYTFGVEYALDGSPVVGGKGAWSLDKRNYFGAAPPKQLSEGPRCMQESGKVWRAMFNEATANLSAVGLSWYDRAGGDTLRSRNAMQTRPNGLPAALSGIAREVVETGPWMLEGPERGPIHFFRRGVAWTPWGGGTWRASGPRTISLKLCADHELTFDSAAEPSRFTYTGGKGGAGVRHTQYTRAAAPIDAHEAHPTVERLLGEGPWAFGDAPISGGESPLAFLRGGVVATPWGPGTYAPLAGSAGDLELTVKGAKHRLTVDGIVGCYQFKATRERDSHAMRGWVMMRHVSMEYTGWRDAWGCQS